MNDKTKSTVRSVISIILVCILTFSVAALLTVYIPSIVADIQGGKTLYTATIDSKNANGGTISLNGSKANKCSYKDGETVTVNAVPDKGYKVSEVKITSDGKVYDSLKTAAVSKDGKKLTSKYLSLSETDASYHFAMPKKNVNVSVKFEKSSDNTTKAKGLSSFANQSSDNDKAFVSNTISKNSALSQESEMTMPVMVKYLMVDANKISKNETIDSVWADPSKIITQLEQPLYFHVDGDQYKVYLGNVITDDTTGILDFAAAYSNNLAKMITCGNFDSNTNIYSISKKDFLKILENWDTSCSTAPMQIQVLVGYKNGINSKSSVAVTIKNNASSAGVQATAKQQTIKAQSFDTQIAIPVATKETADKIGIENIHLYTNGSRNETELDNSRAFYDSSTGKLYLYDSPVAYNDLTVVIDEPSEEPQTRLLRVAGNASNWKDLGANTDDNSAWIPDVLASRGTLTNLKASDTNNLYKSWKYGDTYFWFDTWVAYTSYPGNIGYLSTKQDWVWWVNDNQKEVMKYCLNKCYGLRGDKANFDQTATSSQVNGADLDGGQKESIYLWTSLTQNKKIGDHAYGTMTRNDDMPYKTAWLFPIIVRMKTAKFNDGYSVDLASGLQNEFGFYWDGKDTNNDGQCVGLTCAHIGSAVPEYSSDSNNRNVGGRILAVNPKPQDGSKPYILIGLYLQGTVPISDGGGVGDSHQAGAGVYKMTIPTGTINIAKYDADTDTKIDSGDAVFHLYFDSNSNGAIDDGDKDFGTLSFDGNDYHSGDVPYGNYLIKEEKAPTGYQASDKPIAVSVDATSGDANIWKKVTNEKSKGQIGIAKYDAKTDNKVTTTDAQFALYKDVNGNGTYESSDTFVQNLTYDEGYAAYISDYVSQGKYVVKEIKAPAGYDLSTEVVAVEVTSDNIANGAWKRFNDNPTTYTGSLTVTKLDSETNAKLTGAVFTVTGSNNYSKNLTDNGDGTYSLTGIPEGTYTVKETNAPDGYSIDFSAQTFTVKENQTSFTYTAKDTPEKVVGSVTVTKLDAATKQKLTGAVFTVTGDNNYKKTLVDNGDGTYTLAGIPQGTYTISETTPPANYNIDFTPQTFTVTKDKTSFTYTANDTQVQPDKFSLKIIKQGDNGQVLTGAEFGLYTDESCTRIRDILKDNGDGSYSTTQLAKDTTYYVKETKAPEGYQINDKVIKVALEGSDDVTISADKLTATATVTDEQIKGKLVLNKTSSSDTSKTLSGAEFTVYDANDKEIGKLTESKTVKGQYESGDLVYGTYKVKETKAPAGYALDSTPITVEIKENGKTYVVSNKDNKYFVNSPKNGSISLTKVDAETAEKLTGAEFTVYKDNGTVGKFEAGSDTEFGKMTEDANNKGTYVIENVPFGNYLVKETKAPDGFKLDAGYYPISITDANVSDEHKVVNSTTEGDTQNFINVPKKGNIHIVKFDADTGAKLAGAEFTIYKDVNKNGKYDTGDTEVGKATDNKDGTYDYKDLRMGQYIVKETKAPDKYVLSETEYVVTLSNDGETVDVNGETGIPNTIAKGIIKVAKVDADNQTKTISGAKFEVFADTNNNGKYDEGTDKSAGTLTEGTNGIYSSIKLNYGTYFVKETSAPNGYALDAGTYKVDIKENGKEYFVTNENTADKFTEHGYSIKTTATNADTKTHSAPAADKVTITDTVAYTNLLPNHKYKLSGTLMDKETGKAISVSGATATAEFTTTAAAGNASVVSGTTTVSFSINSSSLAGKSVVVFEKLYDGSEEIASHKDINDTDQTINFVGIRTSAKDSETKEQVALADNNVTIIDTITYNGLTVGEKYTIKGTLMDKESKHTLTGTGATATKEFTADKANGTIDMSFTIDASALKGKSVVVFEKLQQNGKDIAVHEDISDDSQTVDFPDGRTTAVDDKTKTQTALAEKSMTITDTVTYENLLPNKEYTVTGTLMDKETGKALEVDGATSTVKFTPKSKNGTVDVKFTIDGSALASKTIVAFEKVAINGKDVIVHENINDKDETIYVPSGQTTAKDSETGIGLSEADKDVTITDTMTYQNLVPGTKYTVTGKLVDKATGNVIDVKGATASATFTPTSANGSVDLTFKIDGSSLKGKTVVAFERVSVNGKDIIIHEDINDEAETVYFPTGKTNAVDSDTNDHIANADDDVTIKDTVTYSNLIVGKEYTIKGVLMDKETGDKLLVDGKEITAEKTFTADKADGSQTLEFKLKASSIKGKTTVVFEHMYYNGKEVFAHADINDDAQTVHFPTGHTTAVDEKTKTQNSLAAKEMTIVDTVTYKNLIPGKEYSVIGTLMDKETGKALDVDGATSTVKFTPESADGNIDVKFTIDGSALTGKTIVAFEKMQLNRKDVFVHENINDAAETIYVPEGKTIAKDSETEDHISNADDDVTIIDTVEYKNLIPGTEYTVKGKLINKDMNEPVKDKDGNDVVGETTFTPDKANGSVDVKFTFDGSALKGKTVVAFERVYVGNNEVIIHEDINDEAETVYFPNGYTNASDSETGLQESLADNNITIIDTVSYENLLAGKEYTVNGVLMDKKTGTEIKDASGKTITASATFTAGESKDENADNNNAEDTAQPKTTVSGTVDVTFKFDGSTLAGKTAVAFETMQYNGKDVFVHANIDDEAQSVHIPEIHTTACDEETGTHDSEADETVTIIDTVSYKNLIPGVEYLFSGRLVDKATGETVLDADKQAVVGHTLMTPNAPEGSATVEFTLNASNLKGHTLVAYERVSIYENEKEIGIHEDINDAPQTIYFPDGRTTIRDSETGTQNSQADKDVTLIDTVCYENLEPGTEYQVVGTLMDKSTGKPLMVNNKEVHGQASFTPKNADGFVDVIFKFDGSALAGKSVVAFENIYTYGKRIVAHEDINDEAQTAYFPEVHTSAKDKADGDKKLNPTKVSVVDEVSYKNVIAGKTYKIFGTLMDKKTGKAVLVNGKPIVAEKTFTAKNTEGTTDVIFTFNASSLGGKDVVVFEKLLDASGIVIGVHEDINDKSQTVHVREVVKTGSAIVPVILTAIGVAAVAGVAYIVINKRKKEDSVCD